MASPKTRTGKVTPAAQRPTEYLLRSDSGQLSPVTIYKLTARGFELKDVQAMLSVSNLYSQANILSRIVGKPLSKAHRLGINKLPVRLNSHQSAVAFQYASALELAINIFGAQKLAEEWLERPCKHLEGDVPLDVIENAVGFQVVQDYLKRIEYGLYH